jgi:serine/threonine protein kinase
VFDQTPEHLGQKLAKISLKMAKNTKRKQNSGIVFCQMNHFLFSWTSISIMGATGSTFNSQSGLPSKSDFFFSTIIGAGGFSQVSSALHLASKHWIALKSISKAAVLEDPKGINMVSNEVNVLKSLGNYPSVISLHFSFSDDDHIHLAFDLHAGGDLRYHLKANQFSERKAAFVVICIASALHHCHEKGILHRDVKPENIILDAEGFPYLTDFGCSFIAPASQAGGDLVCYDTSGTRQYLAPEIFTKSHRHGVEADFWSLGVILFEMMYSHRPFVKHCPRQAIRFVDDLYKKKIFLTSTSFNYPHANMKTKAPTKAKATPVLELQEPSIGAADDEEETFTTASAVMTTPPITPTNVSLMVPSTARLFEMPVANTTRQDAVASIIQQNKHLKKTFQQLETAARRDMKAAAAGTGVKQAPVTCLTRGGQPYTLFQVRDKLPSSLRPPILPCSPTFGEISDHCVDLIEGLLDVRMWQRLGAGDNYDTLQNHPW